MLHILGLHLFYPISVGFRVFCRPFGTTIIPSLIIPNFAAHGVDRDVGNVEGTRLRITLALNRTNGIHALFSFPSYPVESNHHAVLFSGSKNGYTNCTGCNFSCKMLLNILLHGLILVRVVVQAAGV